MTYIAETLFGIAAGATLYVYAAKDKRTLAVLPFGMLLVMVSALKALDVFGVITLPTADQWLFLSLWVGYVLGAAINVGLWIVSRRLHMPYATILQTTALIVITPFKKWFGA